MDERAATVPPPAEVPPALSVIIPTLNEAHSIGRTLDAVACAARGAEVIVVDGGSADGTAEIARGRGARVITSGRGRGLQMHAGARVARGHVLWFVHADTRPADGCAARIEEALRDPSVVAGNFDVFFDGDSRAARFLTWLYPRLRRLGLCYGDSAIFVRRDVYERVGGFRPFPVFEDLDLVRRLREVGRVSHLSAAVTTSSRRFEGRNFALTFARWSLLQLLYWLGVHPRTLGRLYAPVRGASQGVRKDELLRGRRSPEIL
ncbi:MAG TPA: TIGR04283 family arsenosugar biosynthesis glycosyltransferase [Pyrinomonadaceae bacterium]|nr:TIGR04283 family arsenosugar biosynthesis glycosyltransferase [Pyrinomonadaceae bacterium]